MGASNVSTICNKLKHLSELSWCDFHRSSHVAIFVSFTSCSKDFMFPLQTVTRTMTKHKSLALKHSRIPLVMTHPCDLEFAHRAGNNEEQRCDAEWIALIFKIFPHSIFKELDAKSGVKATKLFGSRVWVCDSVWVCWKLTDFSAATVSEWVSDADVVVGKEHCESASPRSAQLSSSFGSV